MARQLEAAGLSAWDPTGEILPGDNWALMLGRALEDSDALVVLLSPEAVASEHVQREIEYALTSRTEDDLGGTIAKIVRCRGAHAETVSFNRSARMARQLQAVGRRPAACASFRP